MKNELEMALSSRRSLAESVAREQITALTEFAYGLMRPDRASEFEPIKTPFDPADIRSPVQWLAKPHGEFLYRKGRPIHLSGEMWNRSLPPASRVAAPVMPFSVNNANPDLPGTIGLTGQLFADLNEQVAEQMIKNGFKNVVLMGDHGGGQKELGEVAKKLDEKYSSQGIRVVFCDEVYQKAQDDFDKWLTANNYPVSSHAGIPDTSEMLYLGGDKGWVRKELIATAVGDPVRKRGEPRDPNAKRINNGITGDARLSTPELGKRAFDTKVTYAVDQIHRLLNGSKPAATQSH
jgi:creatinine amidohydrolase/Fe(II)-dependent formamide hydrolase-like protein